jgi:hypothetical protein
VSGLYNRQRLHAHLGTAYQSMRWPNTRPELDQDNHELVSKILDTAQRACKPANLRNPCGSIRCGSER